MLDGWSICWMVGLLVGWIGWLVWLDGLVGMVGWVGRMGWVVWSIGFVGFGWFLPSWASLLPLTPPSPPLRYVLLRWATPRSVKTYSTTLERLVLVPRKDGGRRSLRLDGGRNRGREGKGGGG